MSSPAVEVSKFVASRLHSLAESRNEAAVRATLARMRRGVGRSPGEMPELWEVLFADAPERLAGKQDYPSRGEWAAYTALTLFGMHQQGKDLKQRGMHKPGERLGLAVRKLVKSPDDEQRIKRRFDIVATSDTPEEFAYHVRGLIQLLKAADIPLDYAQLAQDLYRFQFSDGRDRVRLTWGRDFYRFQRSNETQEA